MLQYNTNYNNLINNFVLLVYYHLNNIENNKNKNNPKQIVRIILVWCRWRGSNPHEVALEGF